MTTSEQLKKMLTGPVLALTTPFKPDLSLDLDGIRKSVDFYCKSKIGPIIVGGSTGELFSLTMDERKLLLETAVEASAHRLPIIAGCPHSGTALALELVKHAKSVGADGAMVTPPYYTFGGYEGLTRHYEVITNECDLGILVYFSGAVLHQVQDIIAKPELLFKLCELPHISGFKDATGNHWFLRDVSVGLKGKVSVLASAGLGYYMWGWDYGCPGFITGLGNIWPEWEVKFWKAVQANDRPTAQKIAYDLDMPYINFAKRQPKRNGYWAMVKALLDMEGLPGGPMHPPLMDWSKEDLPGLRAEMQRIGLMAR